MMDLLLGIEKFGLESLKGLEIFEKKKEKVEINFSALPKEFKINDFTFEKDFECPVCDNKFKSRVMRADMMRPVATDYDLRPIYQEPIHPMFYDIIICPGCGHTAVNQTFSNVNSAQVKLVLDNIKPKFKYREYPAQLNADMALERYKLALVNAIIKRAHDSEKAYLCMKIAWLYRSKIDKKNENAFIEHAYKGFISALENEYFPMLGMGQNTVIFVIAAYAKTLGHYNDSLKLLGQLLTSSKTSSRLKDRALDMKNEINHDIKEKERIAKEAGTQK